MSASTAAHRLTLVVAPAGYGKTTLLADWMHATGLPSAWLSLDQFDGRPSRLFHGVVSALQSAARSVSRSEGSALLSLERVLAEDPAESYDLVLNALEHLSEPIILVIDDLQMAEPELAHGIVSVLAERAPPTLRLVLSGRCYPSIRLERLRRAEGVGEVQAGDLAFTPNEIERVASSLGQDGADAEGLRQATAGWPIVVHEILAAPVRADCPPDERGNAVPARVPLADYVAEEVLGQLRPPLADFVLRATTCDRLDSRLAAELYGRPGGSLLLQECRRSVLFIEEDSCRGESHYHWSSLFAAQCRAILERRDPLLAERLHRVAARHYQDSDVRLCVAEALRGNDPSRAVTSLGEHWLEFVLRNDTRTLEHLCLGLPAGWSEDPEILMIRWACRHRAGDSSSAPELKKRGLAGLPALAPFRRRRAEINLGLFELFLMEGRPDLVAAAGKGRSLLETADSHPAPHSTGLFLLGQAEMRLLEGGPVAVSLLEEAMAAGRANHLEIIEVCAAAGLALALVSSGDLREADDQGVHALERAAVLEWRSPEQLASVWLARGISCYWKDELPKARAYLAAALRSGTRLFPFGPLALIYQVLVDCATGNPAHLAESNAILDAVDGRGLFQGPLSAFRTLALAKVAEAKGDPDTAIRIARSFGPGGNPPLVDAFLAELLRRGGEATAAQRCVESLANRRRASFVDTSVSLTEALLAHARGETAATHERIEHALNRAEPQSIVRPFAERRGDLAELLVQHTAWGTSHQAFIAARTAPQVQDHAHHTRSYWDLTERELEVLAYMRSMMTAAEMAEALYVSVNTVKTHQRSIYRKLGASGRREALTIAVERGLFEGTDSRAKDGHYDFTVNG
ncbi:helix-turn-helix transcriptional regulator [Arthrobacter mangrovi]|uniref:Helix-turn-helix transcriptional regulator n=1 Tax=Arthrobacter mangrovi TaxID=2966350 RepID=A0ABQ5MX58_9MICC|nr:LuxR C-terminal-related transcriptional regulator [Arthrobacter mangrovi]GLB68365.1 helix-turn-helix transcriptional regulator [Arthrobacter mangrovi]